MAFVDAVKLTDNGIRLEPLSLEHEEGLAMAAADGELWQLRVTHVPTANETRGYISKALDGRESGHRFPFAVINTQTSSVLGTTSYHDIVPDIRRVEIGHTWYAKGAQRTHVNTTCKLLLLTHAFDTLNCNVVGWRADSLNNISQRAIERLGAKKDGIIRGHALRHDGTIRDTVMYSLTKEEWPDIAERLTRLLDR